VALVAASCAEAPGPESRNVLLIAVDTLRADRLGYYGYERATSPEIDALLRQSAVFEDAQATSSWTLPAFASMMTGLRASTHQCWNFKSTLDDSFTTLAELLSERGFATAAVVSHVFMRERYGLGQGFEHYDTSLVRENADVSHASISSPQVTDRAAGWLREWAAGDDRPFFLWVHYFDPHHQYLRHKGFTRKFGLKAEEDLYDGEIAFTDHHIGRLLDVLVELGVDAETTVVFVADHGEEFEEHGQLRHGRSLHAEVIHVPFAFRGPGILPGRLGGTVSPLDLAPTVMELMGQSYPDELPLAGRSLAPLLRADGTMEDLGAVSELRLYADKSSDAIVFRRWKLIVDVSGDQPVHQLYDREEDPGELNDLVAARPDVVEQLSKLLEAQLGDARALSALFEAGEELELSPEDIDRLRELGYVR
jgi:arylsulfatase A-like enzyme